PQRSVPLRVGAQVQEVLRAGDGALTARSVDDGEVVSSTWGFREHVALVTLSHADFSNITGLRTHWPLLVTATTNG
ncbi:hypothetical protein, partial [Rhabdonatronobacter sediminivivens]